MMMLRKLIIKERFRIPSVLRCPGRCYRACDPLFQSNKASPGRKRNSLSMLLSSSFSSPSVSLRHFSITKSDSVTAREKDSMELTVLYQYLNLRKFNSAEINDAFSRIQSSVPLDDDDESTDSITQKHVTQFLLSEIHSRIHSAHDNNIQSFALSESDRFFNVFSHVLVYSQKAPILHRQAFVSQLQSFATDINYSRTIPISFNMFVVGSSVGMIVPMMPWLVYEFGLSTGQYGWVVGSFAIAKCLGNIPATIWTERHGRKPMLTYSLIVIGFGVGFMGISSEFQHLILCRLCTGLGVAALSTTSTLSMTDISTPLNRASTMAPIMSSFAAGTAIGPALGGILADTIGIHYTFYVVGCGYLALAMMNRTTFKETQVQRLEQRLAHLVPPSSTNKTETDKDGLYDAVRNSIGQWSPLLADTKVRNVVLMNGIYWIALAGAQMTILPLILTDTSYGFALTASQIGKVYMGMSLVQVLGNPFLGPWIDRIGKTPAIVLGCTLLSSTMFALPFCTNMTHLATTLGFWALGSTLLSTAPVSYLADKVPETQRAQAVALLRTAGDVGLLTGASTSGAVADWYNMDIALHSSASLLLTTTFWFATRYYLSKKIS